MTTFCVSDCPASGKSAALQPTCPRLQSQKNAKNRRAEKLISPAISVHLRPARPWRAKISLYEKQK